MMMQDEGENFPWTIRCVEVFAGIPVPPIRRPFREKYRNHHQTVPDPHSSGLAELAPDQERGVTTLAEAVRQIPRKAAGI